MGRSRFGWACSAFAPWCMALLLVISITAEAGQDRAVGASRVARNGEFQIPGDYFGGLGSAASGAGGFPIDASLMIGDVEDLASIPDEIDPRADVKVGGDGYPAIDRSRKGDPFVGLRPGLEGHARRPAPNGGPPDPGAALASDPAALAPVVPGQPDAPLARTFDDGGTPSFPLDLALNSATPQPNDGVAIVIGALKPETTIAQKTLANGRPDFAALIDPKGAGREQQCLAEAVYFEARSEPEDGQAAVAQVVLNRLRSGLYPTSVCGVVYQDRNRPFACQFSFACEGKSLRITEPGPWAVATRIAKAVTEGSLYNDQVGSAVNYHANYVLPYWASTLKRVDRIGHHIFYQMRIGENEPLPPGAHL